VGVPQKIISIFGGQTALAESLHTKQSTVQYWARTGGIPSKWHRAIIEAAVLRGLPITGADLIQAGATGLAEPVVLPEAKWPGLLQVQGDEVPCYVLDDGRRVITRTGALNFLTQGKG